MSALLLAFQILTGPDHSTWDTLLKRYLNSESRVDYKSLRQNDATAIDEYLAEFAAPWPKEMTPQAEKAALINLYNATVVRWILANYPVVSIWKTDRPFRGARHRVNGRKISLDEIENRLRKMGDPRIHAALVCAARSCPPLRHEAYVADRLDAQLDDNTRAWLANSDLNEFDAERGKAYVSMIFKWYKNDFESLDDFFAKYAPHYQRGSSISHLTYRWGLNDTSDLGEDYSQLNYLWDAVRHR